MPRTIVLDGETLGVIQPNGLEVLATKSMYMPNMGVIAFDPVLYEGRYRAATQLDFRDFKVHFHPDYLNPLPFPSGM